MGRDDVVERILEIANRGAEIMEVPGFRRRVFRNYEALPESEKRFRRDVLSRHELPSIAAAVGEWLDEHDAATAAAWRDQMGLTSKGAA